MMSFLYSGIGKMLSLALAVVSLVVAVFAAGRRDANKSNEIADLRDNLGAQERINETTIYTTRAAAVKRLRDNGRFRD